jgi:hypothetical protein
MTDMTDKSLFIEETIVNSVKKLLSGRVNELLGETEYPIPPVEFGSYRGGSVVSPVIALSTCERTEKERVIRLDAYALTITFAVPEHPAGERNCYAYTSTVATALRENPTLGGYEMYLQCCRELPEYTREIAFDLLAFRFTMYAEVLKTGGFDGRTGESTILNRG